MIRLQLSESFNVKLILFSNTHLFSLQTYSQFYLKRKALQVYMPEQNAYDPTFIESGDSELSRTILSKEQLQIQADLFRAKYKTYKKCVQNHKFYAEIVANEAQKRAECLQNVRREANEIISPLFQCLTRKNGLRLDYD
ncbi:Hypothetical_protein [Hexamita inflata]|uniref:Hypothetical_protein n=1 Tax=Hexamita inflata TaxID=28002 RepID=A0AA86P9U3_9EUKA|nr:Hypothetical protein HINF_LOCUS22377 [Hexamita inflata]